MEKKPEKLWINYELQIKRNITVLVDVGDFMRMHQLLCITCSMFYQMVIL